MNLFARIFWVLAVILGLTYWFGAMARSNIAFHGLTALNPALIIVWKLLCAGFLTMSVGLVTRSKPMILLTASLSMIVIADFLLAIGHVTIAGGVFVLAHIIAICAYAASNKNREDIASKDIPHLMKWGPWLIPLTVFIGAIFIVKTTDLPAVLAFFPVFSAMSSSFAIRSRFPTILTGMGAAIFMLSDIVFVIGSIGGGPASVGWIVWFCYFVGLALIARGAFEYSAAKP